MSVTGLNDQRIWYNTNSSKLEKKLQKKNMLTLPIHSSRPVQMDGFEPTSSPRTDSSP